jgi:putative NADH-flavin reductase
MKIALLGASGKTGIPLIEQALEKGHSVKAVVRNPSKLEAIKHENVSFLS